MPLTERQRFDRCLREILRHEGGYSDHPSDPGGATNLGITLATAKAHGLDVDGDGDVDKADVRKLTPEQAGKVYRKSYWLAALCDALPAGVDLMVFDLAVNSGVGRAARFLQECVGAKVDGKIGPKTLAATRTVRPVDLVERLYAKRERFYRSLPTFKTFGRGWMRRLEDVTAKSREWAR